MSWTPPLGAVQREPRSRWRPGYWLRHPAFSAFLVGCGVLVVVNCGVGELVDREHLRVRGETTSAVVEKARKPRRGGVLIRVRITTPRGEVVRPRLIDTPEHLPAPGDRLAVIYDPEDLEYAYRPGYESSMSGPLWLIALGVVPGLLYGWYLRRTWSHWRDQAEDWRHRRPVPRLGERQHPGPRRRPRA
ncbi:hypothetical protein GA0074695_0665 [Micromonospora viridifaciens]|uniref:DUF3592 domain-containing protein n=1 Tax=Micromonospora viridifaciens TaxID=1881 RepID=A0A1C4UMZ6_MICVI|nr:hypothetical protein GA0074695_0665 [Micromonospora viridifaciens]